MQRLTHEKVQEIISWHIKNKVPFDVKMTNQRIEFKSAINHVMNRDAQFPAHELNFIQQVKSNIVKHQLHKGIKNRFKKKGSTKKIKYFCYNDIYKVGNSITDCYEIDMKSAYWETAYQMGLLTEDLYKKAMPMSWTDCYKNKLITKKVFQSCANLSPVEAYQRNLIPAPVYKKLIGISKASRLAAIGTLAKTVRLSRFDGQKQKDLPPIRSVETEYLWHEICDKVGSIMYQVAKECGENFMFFWVDAMFVRNKKTVPLVKRLFKQHGYSAEITLCNKIDYTPKKIVVWGKSKWVEIDGKRVKRSDRPFPYKEDAALELKKVTR